MGIRYTCDAIVNGIDLNTQFFTDGAGTHSGVGTFTADIRVDSLELSSSMFDFLILTVLLQALVSHLILPVFNQLYVYY